MAFKDYYRVLEVEPEASCQEIKKAYRRLALAYHPDRNRGDPACEERLKEINEAYQVLGDEAKRSGYDGLCRTAENGFAPHRADWEGVLFEMMQTFARSGFGPGRPGGCRGGGFGKRGCRWKNWNF
ncbi:Chaperone protein DnaJ (fragment) [uncultured Desulfatiglans sp.]|uniref:Chaperone protein DnaJ n=1 Tax=Uncultured Desulfatiglans sp. TaxID=1748965 RepID=A0A653A3Y3_UNCDX